MSILSQLPFLRRSSRWRAGIHSASIDALARPSNLRGDQFPSDPNCLADGDDMMLGASLLVAPVVESGQTTREVYLPAGSRWVSYWSAEAFEGGETIRLPAPFDQPVMLIREGGVIAMNVAEQHFARPADERAFIVVPFAAEGVARGGCVEDDGEREAWRTGEQFSLEQTYSLSARTCIYFLEAYQHASGNALASNGTSIVNAVAVVGDSQNTTPSSGPTQFVGTIGIRHFF